MALSDLGVKLGKIVFKSVDKVSQNPAEVQEKLLMSILEKNKNT